MTDEFWRRRPCRRRRSSRVCSSSTLRSRSLLLRPPRSTRLRADGSPEKNIAGSPNLPAPTRPSPGPPPATEKEKKSAEKSQKIKQSSRRRGKARAIGSYWNEARGAIGETLGFGERGDFGRGAERGGPRRRRHETSRARTREGKEESRVSTRDGGGGCGCRPARGLGFGKTGRRAAGKLTGLPVLATARAYAAALRLDAGSDVG